MDPFWKTFSEELKDRGRDGTPFVFTLAGLVFLLIAAAILKESGLGRLIRPALPWLGSVVVVWAVARGVLAIRHARKRRRERWERHELSWDEWRVARSRLKRDQNRKSA